MKVIYIKEEIVSSKKSKTFYVVRYGLVDENNNVVSKSSPIFWLSKEDYDKFVC